MDAAPKVIQNKISTFDLAKYCALAVYELAEIEPERERLHHRSLEYWIIYPGSVGETNTDIDASEFGMSQESSITCGITFRDNDVIKAIHDEILDKHVSKPKQVPHLDLSNTQGIL